MRIGQKKQVKEFLKILEQAHEEIRSTIEKKNIPVAMSLLEDCQNGAIALGDLIESTEGKKLAQFLFWKNTVRLSMKYI